MLNDQDQRHSATSPHHSYIVQAPAGSGKTEILTQRFLRLLGGVTAPEQIVALTFTRKAANEMRERILGALQKAADKVVATSEHQQRTLSYATEALLRDQSLHWQLLQHPSRLRVITIDSLCQTITQAIPLSERQMSYAQLNAHPERHYQKAARACFQFALMNPDAQKCLKILLEHVDNRQDQLFAFFIDLLARRDQWLNLLYQAKDQEKSTYEQALSFLLEHELERFLGTIPVHLQDELVELASNVACIENDKESPRYPLRNWQSFKPFDSTLAKSLAALLLTSQNTLRKSCDHHVGLKRGACDDVLYKHLKTTSQALFASLAVCPDFLEALKRVKKLPDPTYCPLQWEVLQSLFFLLPFLAAHLELEFHEHNEVDFTAVSTQALMALGSPENPTDLALYFDHTIHHLLVDEFQDTSLQQWELLTQLVQGWQQDDAKTLFVVGDPMQSIYRFRQAEVGLFLRAKRHGIGPVRLIPLELSSNFRSTELIVDFINHHFQSIFPQMDDMESGAVSFHPSSHVHPTDDQSFIKGLQCRDSLDEAQIIAQKVSDELQNHLSAQIAILVRSRNQLPDIIHCLKEKNIPFQGVDIERLSRLPHLWDVWSLTKAYLMPSNRLAWLSFLRSPWCGLSLSDLHAIANHSRKKSILYALAHLDEINPLSEEGRLRAKFVFQILDDALANREHQSLVTCLISILNHCHLEFILTQSQQDDLEQYWRLLERFEQQDKLLDLKQFKIELNKLYSQNVVPSRCQIMTIHKSKGLEFDAVFLPGLGTKPPRMDTQMMRWLKLPSTEHEELILISPIKAAFEETSLLYDYLGQIDAQKNSYELQRLLYVAVTRAKKRLYLLDNNEQARQGTFRQLLRWVNFNPTETKKDDLPLRSPLPSLYHLPRQFYEKTPQVLTSIGLSSPITLTSNTPRLIGIVAHEVLKWICDHHPLLESEIPWTLATHQLKTLGFEQDELRLAQDQLTTQLTAFFRCPIGCWLKQPHTDERNEYELLVLQNHTLATKIIDRTFSEKGCRWVIDFKTGHDDSLQRKKHQEQVNEYASFLQQRFSDETISCGLYYLANQRWITWEYVSETSLQLSYEA